MESSVEGSPYQPLRHRRDWGWPLAAIFVCAVAICTPMVCGQPVVGHDLYVHLSRVNGFNRALGEGCWYPRWLPDVNRGHGGPTFLFYFPAFYYVAAVVHALRPHVYQATLITTVLWFSGGLVAMYAFQIRHVGPGAALAGAIAYGVLPYRAIQLYQRSALTEMAGFLWLPLVFRGVDHLALGAGSGATLALMLAGLLYTHHGVALMALAPLAGYAALVIPRGRRVRCALTLLVGAALAAPSWLPEVLERPYTLIGAADVTVFRLPYWIDFLFDTQYKWLPDFIAMLEHAALLCAGGIVLAIAWLATSRVVPAGRTRWWFFVLVAAGSLWLQHPTSRFVWESVAPLRVVDKPWRFLTIGTFAGAVLIGGMMAARSWWRLAAGALLVVAATVSLAEPIAHRRTEAWVAGWRRPPRAFGDDQYYLPRWVPVAGFGDAGDAVAASGDARLVSLNCRHQIFRVHSEAETELHVPTFYFPGWSATIDGAPAAVALRRDGEIGVAVPAGEHRVVLEFRNTWPRHLANGILVIGGIALVWLWRRGRR